MEDLCEVCGNEKVAGLSVCRFCGSRYEEKVDVPVGEDVHRVVNLEQGKPVVEVAIKRLKREIEEAQRQGVSVLTIIHGYGSSGSGGAIGRECRKLFDYWQSRKVISYYIVGENFSKREGATRSLLRRFPEMATNDNLNRGNRGVTLVVIG
jgi:hypothetical protein